MIKKLNLNDNNCRGREFHEIGPFLASNTSIIALSLAKCNINELGAEDLSYGLKDSRSLQKLNLSYNQIKDQGADAIANAIKYAQRLTNINLASNQIGESGGISLGNSIGQIGMGTFSVLGIQKINLSDNNLNNDAACKIVDGVRKNKFVL